jgi:hypothetical protein
MNNKLKTLVLFLLVSTVSYVSAQDEDGKDSKVGKSTVSDDAKKGSGADINAGLTAKVKPTPEAKTKLESHEKCDNCSKDVGKSESLRKGSFWSRIFGDKKAKKEEDPN